MPNNTPEGFATKERYIEHLEAEVNRLKRVETLRSPAYPHNAWIHNDEITFFYDESQRKPLGRNDKMVFVLKAISLSRFKSFVKSHARDLGLYHWVCGEGGAGYYDNVIDRELYNQCFTIRLSEVLHKMIESDNDLKLRLLEKPTTEYYERNR